MAFHNRGWRGIKIEPVEVFISRLQGSSREDINQRLFAATGRVLFFDIAGTALSPIEPKIAKRRCRAGHTIFEIDVEADTLASICAMLSRDDGHSLKTDVEGGAPGVIEGLTSSGCDPGSRWWTRGGSSSRAVMTTWPITTDSPVMHRDRVRHTRTRIAEERASDREYRFRELQRHLGGAGGGSGTVARTGG